MTAERPSLHFLSAPADPADKWEHDDKPREECGVFGVFGSEDASVLTALGLHGLQHRGQEGCGIVSWDGGRFYHERYLGLVGEHFSGADVPRRLPGAAAIGHTRYATSGGSSPTSPSAASPSPTTATSPTPATCASGWSKTAPSSSRPPIPSASSS